MQWTVEFLDAAVAAELDRLPADIRASFERIVHLIEIAGPQQVHEPYVKHLQGPLWEMRMKGRDGIARGGLCHGVRAPCRGRAGVPQADAENPAP